MSPAEILQRDIYQRLNADAYFADIPLTIMVPLSGEAPQVEARYKQAEAGQLAKAGKYGVAVFIELPDEKQADETIGPRTVAEPQFTIIERKEVNYLSTGTGKSGNAVAHRIVQLLALQHIGAYDDDLAFGTFTRGRIVNPVETDSPSITAVTFEIAVQPAALERVAQPTISAAGLTVTLACATSGASIYYTTNGQFPAAGVTGATLYSGPFVVSEGARLKVAAHKTGLSASPINLKRITS